MLDGRVALITGGSSGIGAAIARLFQSEGCRVAIASNEPAPRIEAICREMDASGNEVRGFACNLAQAEGIDRLAGEVREAFGTVDILVNCAGLFARCPLPDLALEKLQDIVAVNLVAPMLLTRALLPGMRVKGRGSIINIASVGAVAAVENTEVYAATKAALAQFAKILSGSLARSGVRINTIGPGPVRTAMLGFAEKDVSAEQRAELDRRAAFSRSPNGQALIEPDQIAQIALFLASDASSAMQGSYLLADEGWSSVIPV